MTLYGRAAFLAVALITLTITNIAFAAHSDIEIEISPAQSSSGTIVVDPENEAPTTTQFKPSLKLFEAEFGELGNPFGTDDPGMLVEDGNGIEGDILAYEITDTLWKWNGLGWDTTGFNEFIDITDVLSDVVTVSSLSGLGETGLVDAFDIDGGIHSHVEFEIGTTDIGNPSDGAYLLEMLFFGLESDQETETYNPSDRFLIAFHLDDGGTFDEAMFEMAVDSLTAVPVPAAGWLMASALAGLGWVRRRKTIA